MLVFMRKVGSAAILTLPDGRRVRIVLTDIEGPDRARIGFDAPRDVRIHREEIQARVDREGARP